LNAGGRSKPAQELISKRNSNLIPKSLGISMPTLLKFAAEAGVELFRGRPKAAAA
jgi:hypothetical protein